MSLAQDTSPHLAQEVEDSTERIPRVSKGQSYETTSNPTLTYNPKIVRKKFLVWSTRISSPLGE